MCKKSILFLFALLLCPGFFNAQSYDCAKPTHYVMQFLAKSGTKWYGNEEWVKDLKEGVSVETNYLYMHDTRNGTSLKYTGVSVDAYDIRKTPVDTVKAKFIITLDPNGLVIITSLIEDAEVAEVTNLQEIKNLKSLIEEVNDKTENQTDDFSECHYKISPDFDDTTHILRVKLSSSCKTKMPLELFLKEREKNCDGFN